MTVASTLSKVTLSGNGATRAWPFSFPVKDASHLQVTITDPAGAQTTLASGYTVALTDSGGTVTYPVVGDPLADGYKITLRRVVPLTQDTALANQGGFYAEVHEDRFDLLAMADQQQQEVLERAIHLPDAVVANAALPVAPVRAGRYMAFNAVGDPDVSDATRAQVEGVVIASWLDGQSVGDVTGYVGDGVTTRFPTGHNLISKSSVTVVIGGVKQAPESYSIDGQDVVLAAPAPDGVKVDIRVIGVNVALADASGSQVIAAGSTTPRSIGNWLGDTINVLTYILPGYHADIRAGTSSYDCTDAFQAAWNEAKRRGRAEIRITAGRYIVNGTVTSDASYITMRGDGRGATIIVKGNKTGDLFTLTGAFNTVRDFLVEGGLDHTGGWVLNFASAGGNHRVENVDVFRGWNGFYIGGAQTQVRGCILNELAHDGVVFGPNIGLCAASDVSLFGLSTNTGSGFKFLGGDTFQLNNLQVTSHKAGYLLQPPAGGFLYNLFAVNCFADGVGMTTPNGDGWLLDATAAGSTIRRTRLIGCWGSAMTRDGVRIVGAVEDTEVLGAVCVTNVGHGLSVIASPAPKGTRVVGGLFSGNSAPNFGGLTNVYSGIYIGDYVNDFGIFNAHCGPTDTIADTQKYGFEISGVNHDNYQHGFCDVRGNLTGRYLDQGAGAYRQHFGNIGDPVTSATGGNNVMQSLTGEVQFRGTDGSTQVGVGTAAGATLRLLLKGSSPGGNGVVALAGTGNSNLALYPSGAGYGVLLDPQRATWLSGIGGAAGAYPILAAQSFIDAHVDVGISPQGTDGRLRYGTHVSSTDVPVTGYIEIKDASGNIRKLAVVG